MTSMLSAVPEIAKRIVLPQLSRANFAITYRCNYSCKTCNIWQIPKDKQKDELNLWEISQIYDANKLMWISLTGGEPFLRQDIAEILEMTMNFHSVSSIVTNGSMPEHIEKSVKFALDNSTGLLTIGVSLEGEAQEQAKFTGRDNAYEKSMETIKRLVLLKNDRLKVGVEHMLYGQNISDHRHVEKIVKAFNIVETCTLAQNAPFYGNDKLELSGHNGFKHDLSFRGINIATKLFLSKTKNPQCVAGQYSVFIDPYGNVRLCIFKDKILANLKDDPYIPKINYKAEVKGCKGCHTPCEDYATMIFRPWRYIA